MFLVLGIFTTEGENKIVILILARVGCTAKQISVIYFVIFEWPDSFVTMNMQWGDNL